VSWVAVAVSVVYYLGVYTPRCAGLRQFLKPPALPTRHANSLWESPLWEAPLFWAYWVCCLAYFTCVAACSSAPEGRGADGVDAMA
jgi:hypothetical protein